MEMVAYECIVVEARGYGMLLSLAMMPAGWSVLGVNWVPILLLLSVSWVRCTSFHVQLTWFRI